MKEIKQTDAELLVIECDCGFHLGLDASYLEQVHYIKIACPSCGMVIDSRETDVSEEGRVAT